jgi:hypothetical protein
MKAGFGFSLGMFLLLFCGSVFAQVKTQDASAKKMENGQVARPLTTSQSTESVSSQQPSKSISTQPNAAGSTQSQLPSVKVGGTRTYEGGTKAQPSRSTGVPSDKGRIVPREKLIEGK